MSPCPTPDVLVTDGITNGLTVLALPLSIVLAYMFGIFCMWQDNFTNAALDERRSRYGARRLQVLSTTCSTIVSQTLLGLAAMAMVRWTGETSECARRSLGVEWFCYMCVVDLTFGTTLEFVLLWALGIDVQVFQPPVLAITDEDMRRQRHDFRHRKLPALLLIQVLLTTSLKGSSVLLAIIMDQDPPSYGWSTRVAPWSVRGMLVGVMSLYAMVRVLVLDISRGWRTVQLKTPALYMHLDEFNSASRPPHNAGDDPRSPVPDGSIASPRTPPPTTPTERPTLVAMGSPPEATGSV